MCLCVSCLRLGAACSARSVDAALRRAIPAFNPEVKKIQRSLEEVQYLLRIPQVRRFMNAKLTHRKPYSCGVLVCVQHHCAVLTVEVIC